MVRELLVGGNGASSGKSSSKTTVLELPLHEECLLKHTCIWRSPKERIFVGTYYSCIPIQERTNEPVFWAKKVEGRKTAKHALEVVFRGNYHDLPITNVESNVIEVEKFTIAGYAGADPRACFLLSGLPRCVICRIVPQTHDNLCQQCNQRLSYLIGKIKGKFRVKFSRRHRNHLVKRIIGALKNA